MDRIKTLIITGQNNHDWKRSTYFCRGMLLETGKFSVDVAEDAPAALADRDRLENYDLLFLDYNGPDWGEPARSNFEAVVSGGTGLVVLHAADNAFNGWTEYERMLGLMFRGAAGHGEFHEFPVTIVNREHPVTRGVDDFRIWDELYHRMDPIPGVEYEVLATGWSDPAQRGTGSDEPVIIVLQYGRGRVYHHILGHVWPNKISDDYKGSSMITFENPSFQQTLLRGCEWAAGRL